MPWHNHYKVVRHFESTISAIGFGRFLSGFGNRLIQIKTRLCWSQIIVIALFGSLFCVSSIWGQDKSIRTWRDISGQFTVDARFVEMSESGVKLEKADGTQITVEIDRLSLDDLTFLKTLGMEKPGNEALSRPPPPKLPAEISLKQSRVIDIQSELPWSLPISIRAMRTPVVAPTIEVAYRTDGVDTSKQAVPDPFRAESCRVVLSPSCDTWIIVSGTEYTQGSPAFYRSTIFDWQKNELAETNIPIPAASNMAISPSQTELVLAHEVDVF